MHEKGIVIVKLEPGLLYEYSDENFNTSIFGFTKNSQVELPKGYTHFGIVIEGTIILYNETQERHLAAGDFFSIIGPAQIKSSGLGMVNSAKSYRGLNIFGGPIEETGRLRYIDGCTDTLLIAPVKKGDPCLNHLHFPKGIQQTPHVHPSVRTGIIFRGSGECLIPEENKLVPLLPGYAFIIKTETIHSFNTMDESMDVIAFHPDSDIGMTDEDHPMINRTIVDGTSAKFKPEIQTK